MRRKDPETETRRIKQIIEAALTLFVLRGFHATSMRDIASEASLSPALIYRYFKNKAAIVTAVIEDDTDAFLQRIAAFAEDALTPARLRWFLREEIAQRADPDTFRITAEIIAEAARNEAVAKGIAKNIAASEDDLAALLDRMRPGAGRHAAAIIAVIDHIAARSYYGLPPLTEDPLDLLLSAP